MKQHVIGYDCRHSCLMRQVRQFINPHLVIGTPEQRQRHESAIGKGVFQLAQMQGACVISRVWNQDDKQPLTPVNQILPDQMALGLPGASLADGEQPAQPPISGAVGRIGQHRREISKVETTADDQSDSGRFCRDMGLHHACQRIAVTDPERLDPKGFRLLEELDGR